MWLWVPLRRSPRRSGPGSRMSWSDPNRKAKPSHHSDCVKSAQRWFCCVARAASVSLLRARLSSPVSVRRMRSRPRIHGAAADGGSLDVLLLDSKLRSRSLARFCESRRAHRGDSRERLPRGRCRCACGLRQAGLYRWENSSRNLHGFFNLLHVPDEVGETGTCGGRAIRQIARNRGCEALRALFTRR